MKDTTGQTQLVNPPTGQTELTKEELQKKLDETEKKLEASEKKNADKKKDDKIKGAVVKLRAIAPIRYPFNELAPIYEPGQIFEAEEKDLPELTRKLPGSFDFVGERFGRGNDSRHVHQRAEVVK